jgi:protease IV
MKIRKTAMTALLALAALTLQGCITIPPLFGERRGPLKDEIIVPSERFFTVDRILLIDLTGVVDIESGGGMFRSPKPGMLVQVKDRLERARKDRTLKGIILRIDSPGGSVTASDLIHHEIMAFKEERPEIPVIAFMQDVATSGGLYVAMAADEIYALPTTVTGSIGVIAFLPNLQGLTEKIGVGMRVIKSGEVKDAGSPWRDMTEAEQKIFQDMIDSMYGQFLEVVLKSREDKGMTREHLDAFTDGRILTSGQAKELGIIDGVAYPGEVMARARELANSPDAAIISYEYPYSQRMGNIYAKSNAAHASAGWPSQVSLFNIDLGLDRALSVESRFHYLWLP